MADTNEDDKEKVGRPLKFSTVEELDTAIKGYFDSCDEHAENRLREIGQNKSGEPIFGPVLTIVPDRPYTMSGLARALGITRRTLLNYKNRDEFFPSIQGALLRIEEFTESQLYGPYSRGAVFSLINNFNETDGNWTDSKSIDHKSDGKPLKAVVEFIGDEPDDGSGSDSGTDSEV